MDRLKVRPSVSESNVMMGWSVSALNKVKLTTANGEVFGGGSAVGGWSDDAGPARAASIASRGNAPAPCNTLSSTSAARSVVTGAPDQRIG